MVTFEYYTVALVLEFDSHRGHIVYLCIYVYKFKKMLKKKDQQLILKAPSIAGRYDSKRVDEGRSC